MVPPAEHKTWKTTDRVQTVGCVGRYDVFAWYGETFLEHLGVVPWCQARTVPKIECIFDIKRSVYDGQVEVDHSVRWNDGIRLAVNCDFEIFDRCRDFVNADVIYGPTIGTRGEVRTRNIAVADCRGRHGGQNIWTEAVSAWWQPGISMPPS